jgi:hypothetical protein
MSLRAAWRCRAQIAVLVGVVVACSCGGSGGTGATKETPQHSNVVSPREFPNPSTHLTAAATLQLGADCTQTGGPGCKSGICMHVAAKRNSGYACSQLCGPGKDSCPTGYACTQFYPSQDGFACVPLPDAGMPSASTGGAP